MTRHLVWGLGGLVSVLSALGCSGGVHDVGDAPGGSDGVGAGGSDDGESKGGSGGSISYAGYGGKDYGGDGGSSPYAGYGGKDYGGDGGSSPYAGYGGKDYGGDGGSSPYAGYGGKDYGGAGGSISYAGYAGTDYGGYGGGPYKPGCFEPFQAGGEANELKLGPGNAVLLDVHPAQGDIKNDADQRVFPQSLGGVWEAYANYPAATADLASSSTLLLPNKLPLVPNNLAQVHLGRPSCEGVPVGNHKLQVEVWWKASATPAPTHGIALGIVTKANETTWLEDTVKAFVVGDTESKRLLGTLNRIAVQHTFAKSDKTDAGAVVLGFWVVDDASFPSSFYIGNVKWD
jgi:hypothetical protein